MQRGLIDRAAGAWTRQVMHVTELAANPVVDSRAVELGIIAAPGLAVGIAETKKPRNHGDPGLEGWHARRDSNPWPAD